MVSPTSRRAGQIVSLARSLLLCEGDHQYCTSNGEKSADLGLDYGRGMCGVLAWSAVRPSVPPNIVGPKNCYKGWLRLVLTRRSNNARIHSGELQLLSM